MNVATKASIVLDVVASLFDADNKMHQREIDKFVAENAKAYALQLDRPEYLNAGYFLWRGVTHRSSEFIARSRSQPPQKMPSLPLHPELQEKFSLIEERTTRRQNDAVRIKQCLSVLIMPAESEQNVRDCFPDCLAEHLPFRLTRMYPQNFSWKLTPRQEVEYHELLPTMEMYSVSKLFL
ncbi:MAG: hypothetical protein ACK5LG_22060 [Bacteroides thetaiotaomicron]